MTSDDTWATATGSDSGGSDEDQTTELVRTQDFDTPSPIRIDVGNTLGPVVVELSETAVTHVEVRHDPNSTGPDWRGGLAGLLSWVTEQFGEAGLRTGLDERWRGPREPMAEAVRHTRIDLTGNRLVVRTPNTAPLRAIPLAVHVQAPVESEVGIQAGASEVTVSGRAGRVNVQSGSGPVSVGEARDRVTVRTGSGQLRLGTAPAGVHVRSGSGDVEITAVGAQSSVVTGSGNVWLGALSGDVLVRSGSGDVTIADATEGQAELITGSGELQVSIHRGVAAEVDLTSSTGTASSDLDVSEQAPEEEPSLRIFGRTGTGDAVLTTAV